MVAQMAKNLPAVQKTLCWRREWQPTPVFWSGFWSGEFYGQRNLAGYSPLGHKELDMTEQLTRLVLLAPFHGNEKYDSERLSNYPRPQS